MRKKRKRSQAGRILDILLATGEFCGMEPLRWDPPITRVAARIHNLRDRGHRIETIRCPTHGANHAYYRYKGYRTRPS